MANPNDIRTYHGIYMDPFSAKEDEIDIRDIAHALSLCSLSYKATTSYAGGEKSLDTRKTSFC